MHKARILASVLSLIFLVGIQLNAQKISNVNGKCYALAVMPDQYEEITNKYPSYTGDNFENNDEIEEVKVLIKPGKNAWVKKKMENCKGSGDDCLVWCYVETEGETISMFVVKDPSSSKEYKWTEVSQSKLIKKGGYTEKVEIACKKKLSPEIINRIQIGLSDAGFDPGKSSKRMNSLTKRALANFQRANNLPVGQLDIQTLQALQVSL